MSKETWAQFARRVKPTDGQQFTDERGHYWKYDRQAYSFKNPTTEYSIMLLEIGNMIPCSLRDAIEHVEKPKLKKVTLYGYVSYFGFHWSCRDDFNEKKALDENGNRITKEVWVIDNE